VSPPQKRALVLALTAPRDTFGWMPCLSWTIQTWQGPRKHYVSKTTALSLEKRGMFERGRSRFSDAGDPWPYYFRLTPRGWKVAQELDSKENSE
jgi:hypothetical protein